MSTTFKQFAPGQHAGYEYGRSGNPTRNSLEEGLAPLEKAKYALTFSSGLGALTAMSFLLKSGDHIVTVVRISLGFLKLSINSSLNLKKKDDVYGGTNRFFRNCSNRMGIETSFVDMTDLAKFEEAFTPNTAVFNLFHKVVLKKDEID